MGVALKVSHFYFVAFCSLCILILCSEDALMAIFDGEQYVYQDTGGWGWWNTAKILWKYGMSPIKARNLMKRLLKSWEFMSRLLARTVGAD